MFLHSDPLVMKVDIDGQFVKRVLIDEGTSINVLYKYTIKCTQIENMNFISASSPIVRFSGDSEGKTFLPVTITNDYGISRTTV